MNPVLVARQPIFDVQGRVFAYELLYRARLDATSAPASMAPTTMASSVIVDALLDIGIQRMTEGRPAFMNLSEPLVLAGVPDVLDPDDVVLELLETVRPTPDVIDACRALRERGFRLALDDFVHHPAYDPLIELCDFVKIDVLAGSGDLGASLGPLVDRGVCLLAEKVEDGEVYDRCVDLGFELFQGFHLVRPESLVGRTLGAETLAVVRIINLLADPETPDRSVEEAFRGDAVLTYKLLRMANSAALGGRNIESIGHALRLVGRRRLQRWMCLLLIASGEDGAPGRKLELLKAALIRARMCERLAEDVGLGSEADLDPDGAFLVGLLSLLDQLLGVSPEPLIRSLRLAPPLKSALLEYRGPLGSILNAVVAYAEGRWSRSFPSVPGTASPPGSMREAYLDALDWTLTRSGVQTVATAA